MLIAGVFLKNNILLLGGSGTLGSTIIKSRIYPNLKYPTKKKLNILNKNKIINYLIENKIKLILHCAAVARVKQCELNKKKAKKININGTKNIVNAIKKVNKNIKLVFISSDAVYSADKGNNKETEKLSPYNVYGKTKVEGEKIVKSLRKFIIIRTRFFDKKKILFKYSATNIYTSAIEVKKLVRYISILIKKNYNGIINVGGPKISDFKKYRKYKKNLLPCDKEKIFNQIKFKIATDASLNLNKLKKTI